VAANADDARCYSAGGGWYDDVAVNIGNNGNACHSFFRFTDVTIPKGSTISSAVLRWKQFATGTSTPCYVKIYIEDNDTTTAATDAITLLAKPLDAGTSRWTVPGYSDNGVYDTVDFSSILETHLARSGWSSGNALTVHVVDDGGTAGRFVDSRNQSATTCAQLRVEYT